MIVSFHHQNKTKREREKMRPTTKTKREREHAPSNNTHTHTQSHLPSKQKVNYSQHPMGGSNPRPPSKRNNAVHHQGKKE